MPKWGPYGFSVGNWASGLNVGKPCGSQVGLVWVCFKKLIFIFCTDFAFRSSWLFIPAT